MREEPGADFDGATFNQEWRAGAVKIKADVMCRWLIKQDMPEVLQIEGHSFELPWTEEDFLCVLRQRDTIGMIAESGGETVGFMIYELHKDHLRILNFAVDQAFRRQGVGAAMVDRLKGKLSQTRRKRILFEVSEKSLDAQKFFRSQGFVAYAGTGTDEDPICGCRTIARDLIHWVIIGGESGNKARPCNVEWIRSMLHQCCMAGVPCFIKQLGSLPYTPHPGWDEPHEFNGVYDDELELRDSHGGDWDEWPDDLKVREFPK